jgi:hypothetical protein
MSNNNTSLIGEDHMKWKYMLCLKLLDPWRELGDNFGMGETLFVFVFWPNLLASWRPGCVLAVSCVRPLGAGQNLSLRRCGTAPARRWGTCDDLRLRIRFKIHCCQNQYKPMVDIFWVLNYKLSTTVALISNQNLKLFLWYLNIFKYI